MPIHRSVGGVSRPGSAIVVGGPGEFKDAGCTHSSASSRATERRTSSTISGGDLAGAPVSKGGSGSYSMESQYGSFDNWTSNQAVDRAFKLYTTTLVFRDGFESGNHDAWSFVGN